MVDCLDARDRFVPDFPDYSVYSFRWPLHRFRVTRSAPCQSSDLRASPRDLYRVGRPHADPRHCGDGVTGEDEGFLVVAGSSPRSGGWEETRAEARDYKEEEPISRLIG